jgi:hypothetical protein
MMAGAVTRALSLVEFVGAKRNEDGTIEVPKRRPRAKTIAASSFRKTLEETREMITSGDWAGFSARHVLALYDLMHEKCYGVAPIMTSKERHTAVLAGGGFVKRIFDGSFEDAVEYFRWIWDREIGREAWRKAEQKETRPMSFYWSISTRLVNDYRVAMANRRRRP